MPLAWITLVDPGSVDPGYGRPSLPGWGGPVDPGFGHRPPVDPGYGIGEGARPGHGLPNAPVLPGYPLPPPPLDPGFGVGRPPTDPGYDRPDWVAGVRPSTPIYYPDKPIPPGESPPPASNKPIVPPDAVWPPLPSHPMMGWILVWLIGVGYRWLHVGHPDNTLPETPPTTATPRRP